MKKVLIVDDKADNIYLLRILLENKGYGVITAANGQEALVLAEAAPPDMIISDILMPVMDGYAFCRHCKKHPRLRSIPFIFYTATYTDSKDEKFALSLGADLFIVKPSEPDVFLKTIDDFLSGQIKLSVVAGASAPPDEETFLRQYNATLIRKLEEKVIQVEEANKILAIKNFAIASSISGIVMLDLSGIITYANDSFALIFNCATDDIIGKNLSSLLKEANVLLPMQRAIARVGGWIGEVAGHRSDGMPFSIQVVSHIVNDPFGQPVCTMVSCIDILERKLMMEELQRTQRLEALSLFAGGIAHDFNNLLAGMFGNAELAKSALPPDSTVHQYLDTVISIFERARDLTQRLLTFAKGSSPVKTQVSLADLLSECSSLSLSGSNVRRTISIPPDTWSVEGDASQLSQVFNNIIINARQAMPDGGVLSISANNTTLSDGQLGHLRAGDYVEIILKDQGAGISPDILPRIFDPFFTTKHHGNGLGLATSYSIVVNHNGYIGAKSSLGDGAEFTVILPAQRGESKAEEIPEEVEEEDLAGSGNILVMDDEEIICLMAKEILELNGYSVTTVPDGQAAINVYKEAFDAGTRFDLVILDLTVRNGMGGTKAIVELQKIDPNVVAVVSSGHTNSSIVMKPHEYGFSATLSKPYLAHELCSMVKALITQSR